MAVTITATYEGELHCDATHEPSGIRLHTDAPVDNGGKGESFSPTDLVATALGTCILTIMAMVANRHQIELRGTRVRVVKEMIQQPVRRIGALRATVYLPAGLELDENNKRRLEAAAHSCPVHQSLHPDIDAPIEFVDG